MAKRRENLNISISKNNELVEKIIQYQELIEVFEGQEKDWKNREKDLIQENSRMLLDIKQAEEISQKSQKCLNFITDSFPSLIKDDGSLNSKRLKFYQNAEDKINSLKEKNEELELEKNGWKENLLRLDEDIKKIDEYLGIVGYDSDDIQSIDLEKVAKYKKDQSELLSQKAKNNEIKSQLEIVKSKAIKFEIITNENDGLKLLNEQGEIDESKISFYKKAQENILEKDSDLQEFSWEIEALKSQLEETEFSWEEKYQELNQRFISLSENFQINEQEKTKLQTQISENQKEINSLDSKNQSLLSKNIGLTSELESEKEKRISLETQQSLDSEQSQEEIENLRTSFDEATKEKSELDIANVAINSLKEEKTGLEINLDKRSQLITSLNEKINLFESEIAERKKNYQSILEEKKDLDLLNRENLLKSRDWERNLQKELENNSDLQIQLDDKSKKNEELELKLQKEQEKLSENELFLRQQKITSKLLESQINELEEKIISLRSDLESRESVIKEKENRLEETKRSLNEKGELISKNKREIDELKKNYQQNQKKLEQAESFGLTEWDNLITQTEGKVLNDFKNERDDAWRQVIDLTKERDTRPTREDLNIAEAEINNLIEEKNVIQNDLIKSQKELTAVNNGIVDLKKRAETIAEELEELRNAKIDLDKANENIAILITERDNNFRKRNSHQTNFENENCACPEKINSDLGLEIKFDSEDKNIDKLEKVIKKLDELLKDPNNKNKELEKNLEEAKKTISELQKQLIGVESLDKIKEIDIDNLSIILSGNIGGKKEKDLKEADSYQQVSTVRQEIINNHIQQQVKSNERLIKQRSILSFFLVINLLAIGSLIWKTRSRISKKIKISQSWIFNH
jgi:chromosome segregation ATPase